MSALETLVFMLLPSKRILDLVGEDFYTKPWPGEYDDEEEFAPVTGAIDPDIDEELDQN